MKEITPQNELPADNHTIEDNAESAGDSDSRASADSGSSSIAVVNGDEGIPPSESPSSPKKIEKKRRRSVFERSMSPSPPPREEREKGGRGAASGPPTKRQRTMQLPGVRHPSRPAASLPRRRQVVRGPQGSRMPATTATYYNSSVPREASTLDYAATQIFGNLRPVVEQFITTFSGSSANQSNASSSSKIDDACNRPSASSFGADDRRTSVAPEDSQNSTTSTPFGAGESSAGADYNETSPLATSSSSLETASAPITEVKCEPQADDIEFESKYDLEMSPVDEPAEGDDPATNEASGINTANDANMSDEPAKDTAGVSTAFVDQQVMEELTEEATNASEARAMVNEATGTLTASQLSPPPDMAGIFFDNVYIPPESFAEALENRGDAGPSTRARRLADERNKKALREKRLEETRRQERERREQEQEQRWQMYDDEENPFFVRNPTAMPSMSDVARGKQSAAPVRFVRLPAEAGPSSSSSTVRTTSRPTTSAVPEGDFLDDARRLLADLRAANTRHSQPLPPPSSRPPPRAPPLSRQPSKLLITNNDLDDPEVPMESKEARAARKAENKRKRHEVLARANREMREEPTPARATRCSHGRTCRWNATVNYQDISGEVSDGPYALPREVKDEWREYIRWFEQRVSEDAQRYEEALGPPNPIPGQPRVPTAPALHRTHSYTEVDFDMMEQLMEQRNALEAASTDATPTELPTISQPESSDFRSVRRSPPRRLSTEHGGARSRPYPVPQERHMLPRSLLDDLRAFADSIPSEPVRKQISSRRVRPSERKSRIVRPSPIIAERSRPKTNATTGSALESSAPASLLPSPDVAEKKTAQEQGKAKHNRETLDENPFDLRSGPSSLPRFESRGPSRPRFEILSETPTQGHSAPPPPPPRVPSPAPSSPAPSPAPAAGGSSESSSSRPPSSPGPSNRPSKRPLPDEFGKESAESRKRPRNQSVNSKNDVYEERKRLIIHRSDALTVDGAKHYQANLVPVTNDSLTAEEERAHLPHSRTQPIRSYVIPPAGRKDVSQPSPLNPDRNAPDAHLRSSVARVHHRRREVIAMEKATQKQVLFEARMPLTIEETRHSFFQPGARSEEIIFKDEFRDKRRNEKTKEPKELKKLFMRKKARADELEMLRKLGNQDIITIRVNGQIMHFRVRRTADVRIQEHVGEGPTAQEETDGRMEIDEETSGATNNDRQMDVNGGSQDTVVAAAESVEGNDGEVPRGAPNEANNVKTQSDDVEMVDLTGDSSEGNSFEEEREVERESAALSGTRVVQHVTQEDEDEDEDKNEDADDNDNDDDNDNGNDDNQQQQPQKEESMTPATSPPSTSSRPRVHDTQAALSLSGGDSDSTTSRPSPAPPRSSSRVQDTQDSDGSGSDVFGPTVSLPSSGAPALASSLPRVHDTRDSLSAGPQPEERDDSSDHCEQHMPVQASVPLSLQGPSSSSTSTEHLIANVNTPQPEPPVVPAPATESESDPRVFTDEELFAPSLRTSIDDRWNAEWSAIAPALMRHTHPRTIDEAGALAHDLYPYEHPDTRREVPLQSLLASARVQAVRQFLEPHRETAAASASRIRNVHMAMTRPYREARLRREKEKREKEKRRD